MNWKGCRRRRSQSKQTYCTRICLEELKKSIKYRSQDSRSPNKIWMCCPLNTKHRMSETHNEIVGCRVLWGNSIKGWYHRTRNHVLHSGVHKMAFSAVRKFYFGSNITEVTGSPPCQKCQQDMWKDLWDTHNILFTAIRRPVFIVKDVVNFWISSGQYRRKIVLFTDSLNEGKSDWGFWWEYLEFKEVTRDWRKLHNEKLVS
jgi:hypothetical protein